MRLRLQCEYGNTMVISTASPKSVHAMARRWGVAQVFRVFDHATPCRRGLSLATAGGFHHLVAAGAAVSDLAYGSGVLGDDRVGGQQQDALDCRLRDEQAIEGVLVDRRQTGDRDGMLAGDRELVIAVVQ